MNQFSNKKLIVANWKMQPESWAEAEQILDFVNNHLESRNEKEFSLVFCPPFVFLEEVGKVLKISHFEHNAELGAQDIFWDDQGADTGEISGPMLSKLGVRYVIIGHSERRWKLSESDEIVNKKLKAVLRNGMTPIVCLGEKVRDENFEQFLKEQTEKTFAGLSADEINRCFIAYEPVWAISTNPDALPDTPQNALESIRVIQEVLIGNWKLEIENGHKGHHHKGDCSTAFGCCSASRGCLPKVLYGGSVTSKNVADFIGQKEIDGVLVGSASVNKEEFVKVLSLIK